MAKAMEHIRYLVEIVGYRPPTSEGERWASKYIRGVMEKAGIESQLETFQSHKTFSYPYMIIFAVSVLGGLLAPSHGLVGFLVALVGAVGFYGENTCRGWVSRFLPRDPSQNVVGRIPPKGEVRRTVLLSAHYDTSKTGLPFHPRFVGGFRTASILTLVAVFGLPLSILLGGLFWSGLFGLFRCLAVIWLLLDLVLLLHREVYGKNVYGANDNASGTGVLLAVAEGLATAPLENTEVWIAATGCEEVGMVGMLALLERHGQELEDALIVNLDGVGAGQLNYITGEGMIRAYPSDPELLMLAAEVVRETPELGLEPREYRALLTDGYAALVKGFRAMSVMAFDEQGVTANWHWETDVIENLEEKNLADTQKFVELLLKKIDSER